MMNKLRFYITNNYVLRTLMILPLVIFFVVFIFIIGQKPYVIFPKQKGIVFKSYSDKNGQGNSEINYFLVDDEGIHFAYTLKKGINFPYAGINFFRQSHSSYFDVSNYTHVTIFIETASDNNFTIHLNTFIDNFTSPNSHLSYSFFQYTFFTTPNTKVYKLRIKDFTVPDWWFEHNNTDFALVENEDFSKVRLVSIVNGPYNPFNEQQKIIIKKIQFERDKQKPLIFLTLIVILYVIGLTLGIIILKSKRAKPGLVYTSLDLSEKALDQSGDPVSLEQTVSYIADHYHNMDLTVEMVSKELNIAAYKISQLLKETFDLSYPAYINEIRITEAKRLLLETDMKIIDIAMTIGYKSVSHYHRIFKKHTGLSPKQFRQDNRP